MCARERSRRGTAAVEFAIVLPIFLVLVLGIIECGRGMMVAEALANAARIGARRASIDTATNSEVQQTVRDFCTSSLALTPEQIDVTISVNGNASAQIADAVEGDLCSVTVDVAFSDVSWLPTSMWFGERQIRGSCSMEHEQ
jgi:Flp pilus assembly protein TadG